MGGWVPGGLTRNFFLENHPKIALNQYRYFGVLYRILSVDTSLKVVSYYDLSVLFMGFQKKFGWWVG